MQPAVSRAAALMPSEIELAASHLRQTTNCLIGAIKGTTDNQWTFRATPGSWSIAEIVEHILFVQERVVGMVCTQLTAGTPASADRDCQRIDAVIINQFPNRLGKFPAPEPSHPKGNLPLALALERISANAQSLAECLATVPDLRKFVLDSPPLKAISKGEYTVMDGYQWILAASAHTERHTKQILEVRADPAFPLT